MTEETKDLAVEGDETLNPIEKQDIDYREAADAGTSEDIDEVEASEDDSTDEQASLGGFKDTEALLKSYQHMESMQGRTQNEVHSLKQEIQKLQQSENPEKELELFAAEIKKDPLGAIKKVARNEQRAALSKLEAQTFVSEVEYRMKDDEFAKHADLMAEIGTQYKPYIEAAGLKNNPLVLDMLYYMAKGMDVQTSVEAAEAKGKKAGAKQSRKRNKAQIEGASSTKGKTPRPDFNKLSSEEMRKLLEAGKA